MKLPYEFRQRCEKIAAEQRRLLERAAHDPLHGEDLAAYHSIQLREPSEMPGTTSEIASDATQRTDWDGLLLPALPNHPAIILLRPGAPSSRRQSTIMHEIAHYLLSHAPLMWDESLGRFSPRRSLDEAEAAYLGGCLQIPKIGLIWAAQTGLTVTRTASNFGASEKMVVYRTKIMGVSLRG